MKYFIFMILFLTLTACGSDVSDQAQSSKDASKAWVKAAHERALYEASPEFRAKMLEKYK